MTTKAGRWELLKTTSSPIYDTWRCPVRGGWLYETLTKGGQPSIAPDEETTRAMREDIAAERAAQSTTTTAAPGPRAPRR